MCPVAAASGADLRKHWKGVVRFISPLLVHFKLSNNLVVNRNTAWWLSERRCFATQTGWIYEWTCERSVTKWCWYVSAYFFKWVYANPWPFLSSIRRIPAYHVDYTTALVGLQHYFSSIKVHYVLNLSFFLPSFGWDVKPRSWLSVVIKNPMALLVKSRV